MTQPISKPELKDESNIPDFWGGDEDEVVDDYCSGNVDDAYSMGRDHGEVFGWNECVRAFEKWLKSQEK